MLRGLRGFVSVARLFSNSSNFSMSGMLWKRHNSPSTFAHFWTSRATWISTVISRRDTRLPNPQSLSNGMGRHVVEKLQQTEIALYVEVWGPSENDDPGLHFRKVETSSTWNNVQLSIAIDRDSTAIATFNCDCNSQPRFNFSTLNCDCNFQPRFGFSTLNCDSNFQRRFDLSQHFNCDSNFQPWFTFSASAVPTAVYNCY